MVITLREFRLKSDTSVFGSIKSFVLSGGRGPGSYYPWVYLQIAVILPYTKKLLDKGTVIRNGIVFLIVCELFEIVSSITNLPDSFHRLLAIRYLFLLYLAWIWVNKGITINRKTIILSSLSFLTIIYFEYFSVNDEILFYNTAWKYHRWPCYYFVAMGGVILLRCLYDKLCNKEKSKIIIDLLARCSYEIFLIQMLVISLYPSNLMISMLQNVGFKGVAFSVTSVAINVITVFTMSILIGYYFNKYYNRLMLQQKI
jgi:peptidoglycan/LPS O-acetylase OafA/YrhL